MHFGKVLMSSGGNDWTAEEPGACKHTDFGAMRDIAYETAGITHVPVRSYVLFSCQESFIKCMRRSGLHRDFTSHLRLTTLSTGDKCLNQLSSLTRAGIFYSGQHQYVLTPIQVSQLVARH